MDEMMKQRLDDAGVDVEEALSRLLHNEELLMRLLRAFLQDASFGQLQRALAARDADAAFAAAHTLKGVAGNLSLKALFESVSEAVECLRKGDVDAANSHMPAVEEAYCKVAEALRANA